MFNIVQGQKKKKWSNRNKQRIPGITRDQKKAGYSSHALNKESIQQEGER